jgi:CheY-like chemotaxis protein
MRAAENHSGEASKSVKTMKSQMLREIRVLIVDDHPDAHELLALIITSAGATVKDADNAEAAYAIVERWKPNIIVADLHMPDQDGYAFMKRIRARPKEEGGQIPAVAITGYGPEDRLTAFRAGYQNYIRKPVNAEELVAAIASLIVWD